MIFFLFFYFVALLWIFHIKKIDVDVDNKETKKLTFVIKNIIDVDSMISSLDSIINSNQENHAIDIILIDSTTQDLNLITKDYSKYFSKIIILKNSKNDNFLDQINDLNSNSEEFIIIESGILIGKNFFDIIRNAILTIKESVIYFAITANSKKKYFSFIQLYESLMQSFLSSLINKNLLNKHLLDYPALIVRSSIVKSVDTKESLDTVDHLFFIDINTHKENYSEIPDYDLGSFKILYLLGNVVFLVSIAQYVYMPNLYSLISILLKVISEFVLVYSYHQSLKIKFPKVEFVIFSIIHPFYMIYNMARKSLYFNK